MSHLSCLNIFLHERFFFSFLEILPLPSTWLMLECWEPFLIPLVWACAFSCYLVWSFWFQIVQTLDSSFTVFSEIFWTQKSCSFPCLTRTGYSLRRTTIVQMAPCQPQFLLKACHTILFIGGNIPQKLHPILFSAWYICHHGGVRLSIHPCSFLLTWLLL